MKTRSSMHLIQWPANPISPKVSFPLRPVSGKAVKFGTTGYIVIDAAVPSRIPAPDDATHLAPTSPATFHGVHDVTHHVTRRATNTSSVSYPMGYLKSSRSA